MSVRIYLASLTINLHFNLLSSWAMQIVANLRVQGGCRGYSHGSAVFSNFSKVYDTLLGKPVPFHLETMKRNNRTITKKAETIPYGEKL